MGKAVCLTLVFLVSSVLSFGQNLPDAPSQHRFWDKPNKVLFFSHVALEAADFGITHRNLSRGGREMNPMGKALCESGTLGQVVFFGGRVAGVAGVSYLFHKLGYHKLERVFMVVASVDSASGVKYSLSH